MRALGDGDIKALRRGAGHFARWGTPRTPKEAYNKLGDHAGLMSLYIESAQWDDALALLRRHPEYSDRVYLPYAGWLADHDRFDEARAACRKHDGLLSTAHAGATDAQCSDGGVE